jgi:hypothetical protein
MWEGQIKNGKSEKVGDWAFNSTARKLTLSLKITNLTQVTVKKNHFLRKNIYTEGEDTWKKNLWGNRKSDLFPKNQFFSQKNQICCLIFFSQNFFFPKNPIFSHKNQTFSQISQNMLEVWFVLSWFCLFC